MNTETIFESVPSHGIAVSGFASFRDLEFAKSLVKSYSSRGTPYLREVPFGMPRIPPKFLDSVCYCYHNVDDAKAGRDFGGTAFLVGVPSVIPGRVFVYAVTNWHVAVQSGASVLRLNTHDGQVDVFDFGPEEWEFDPALDIAVRALSLNKTHRIGVMGIESLVTEKQIENHKMGPGEDVFMIGRFIDHDGGPINRPSVRFGNISVMPSPIEQPNGIMADAYCVDLHSRSGYSGSPVFYIGRRGMISKKGGRRSSRI